jgi:sodium-dependent dicarboxylate transporter 2/3/5
MAKILLVDDEDCFRNSLALRLRLRGYDTLDVSSGRDALAAVRNDPLIDVLIVDCGMPEMDGAQIFHAVKQASAGISVIVLSGMGALGLPGNLPHESAFAVLEKPADLEALIEAIDAARRANDQTPRPEVRESPD